MRLIEIRINKLFNHFDHFVPLNYKDKITILTAPNGYGKTMVLKIIHAVFSKNFTFIKSLDFKDIILTFENNHLKINKTNKGEIEISLIEGMPDNYSTKKTRGKYIVKDEESETFAFNGVSHIADMIPHLSRISKLEWLDQIENEILSLNDVIEKYPQISSFLGGATTKMPEWLIDIINGVNVHIVRDQRLILRSEINYSDRNISSRHRKRTIDTIEKYSSELTNAIANCNNSYSEVSKKLDSTLPSRLLSRTKAIEIFDIDTLRKKLDDLKLKNERLREFDLLSNQAFIPDIEGISDEDIKILSLYVQDNTEKLSVYDDILSRIELFTKILNDKGLSFKKVSINPKDGFLFKTDSGKTLQLTQLSSGEQHEVVLIYELIFIAKDNDLVLIDEPEISLHIAWQKEFLEDIKKIIDIQNVSVIIATHSPQIIDNNWDLVIDLEKVSK